MITVLNFIWENIWTLILIAAIIKYGRKIYQDLIFTPLAGGNGKVQMDEVAKAIILIVFVLSAYKEANRTTEHQVFTDTYFAALLLTVCAIAAIKPLFSNMDILKGKKDPEKQNNDQ